MHYHLRTRDQRKKLVKVIRKFSSVLGCPLDAGRGGDI